MKQGYAKTPNLTEQKTELFARWVTQTNALLIVLFVVVHRPSVIQIHTFALFHNETEELESGNVEDVVSMCIHSDADKQASDPVTVPVLQTLSGDNHRNRNADRLAHEL
jgi:hypothetical protein